MMIFEPRNVILSSPRTCPAAEHFSHRLDNFPPLVFTSVCVCVCVMLGNSAQCVCRVWCVKTYLDDESQKFGLINVWWPRIKKCACVYGFECITFQGFIFYT